MVLWAKSCDRRIAAAMCAVWVTTPCSAQSTVPSAFARTEQILPSPGATYECFPNAGGGKRKCDAIPVIVYEAPITAAGFANCVVLLPYDNLKIHTKGSGTVGTTVTFVLDSPDDSRFDLQDVTFVAGLPAKYSASPAGKKVKLNLQDGIAKSPPAGYRHEAKVIDNSVNKPCFPIDPVVINTD